MHDFYDLEQKNKTGLKACFFMQFKNCRFFGRRKMFIFRNTCLLAVTSQRKALELTAASHGQKTDRTD